MSIFGPIQSVKCPSWYKLYMSSESESEDNLVEQAYDYKVSWRMNKKMSIRRKADKIVLQNGEMCIKKKMKGTNEVGKNK